MSKKRKWLLSCVTIAICCSILMLSASASTIVLVGSKSGATSSVYSGVDYDLMAYVEYDYIGPATSSNYDYVIDIASMSTYVTNRGVELTGTSYRAESLDNYASTLNHYNYVNESIPTNVTYQYKNVNWDVVAGWFSQDTMYHFNGGSNQGMVTTIGTTYVDYGEEIGLGYFTTVWQYSAGSAIHNSTWHA